MSAAARRPQSATRATAGRRLKSGCLHQVQQTRTRRATSNSFNHGQTESAPVPGANGGKGGRLLFREGVSVCPDGPTGPASRSKHRKVFLIYDPDAGGSVAARGPGVTCGGFGPAGANPACTQASLPTNLTTATAFRSLLILIGFFGAINHNYIDGAFLRI